MFAPIFLPQGRDPSPEVLAAERDIVTDEGCLNVGGMQYANESDARQARGWEAERRVRNYTRVLDYARSEDRAIIARIIDGRVTRNPVGVA